VRRAGVVRPPLERPINQRGRFAIAANFARFVSALASPARGGQRALAGEREIFCNFFEHGRRNLGRPVPHGRAFHGAGGERRPTADRWFSIWNAPDCRREGLPTVDARRPSDGHWVIEGHGRETGHRAAGGSYHRTQAPGGAPSGPCRPTPHKTRTIAAQNAPPAGPLKTNASSKWIDFPSFLAGAGGGT
jgi:hypothetical protein